jgi:hypothetical protein
MTARATKRKTLSFDDVREIGLALPGVEESTSYGTASLKIHGKLMACPAINKSAEPGSIAFLMSFDDRDALLSEAPDIYYLTDHYVNYPCVLVRLSRIEREALKDLVRMSWQFVTRESPTRKKAAKRRRR